VGQHTADAPVLKLSNSISPTVAAASNSALKFILNDWYGEAAIRCGSKPAKSQYRYRTFAAAFRSELFGKPS